MINEQQIFVLLLLNDQYGSKYMLDTSHKGVKFHSLLL